MTHTRWTASCTRGLLATAAAALLMTSACERKAEQPATALEEWREFEGSWNATGTRRSIRLGGDRRGSVTDLHGTMLLAGAGRPGVGFRADVIAMVDTETGMVGRAVWTDDRGDEVFSELKGEGTRERNHIVGTILGGTGRFVGATGTFEFSWQYVIESEDGSVQGRAVGLRGRFRLGQPAAGGATP